MNIAAVITQISALTSNAHSHSWHWPVIVQAKQSKYVSTAVIWIWCSSKKCPKVLKWKYIFIQYKLHSPIENNLRHCFGFCFCFVVVTVVGFEFSMRLKRMLWKKKSGIIYDVLTNVSILTPLPLLFPSHGRRTLKPCESASEAKK